MSSTQAGPDEPAGGSRTLHLSNLLRRPLLDSRGETVGKLSDVIVRLRGADRPLVTGLVASVGGREVFVPEEQVSAVDGDVLRLLSPRLDLRRFERRDGEVLLRSDVLGHRLIDVESARLVRAADLQLEQRDGAWVLSGVDTHRRPRRLFGSLGRSAGSEVGHSFRPWANFEPLIGHTSSALLRGPFARIRRSLTCSRMRRKKRRPRSWVRCTLTRSWKPTSSRS